MTHMTAKTFCAHRGVSALMPENTLPSFAAAISLGADEIEFDIRLTKDGELIVSHDNSLARISNGTGALLDYTLDELRCFNIGVHHGWQVSFCTAEEVFAHFANKTVFNIHIKEHGDGFVPRELKNLAESYHALDSVYFAGTISLLKRMVTAAPDIPRAAIQLPSEPVPIYDTAIAYGCRRVQFWDGMFDEELIARLHEAGIHCNHFHAETYEEYDRFFSMGVDTLLTNRMDLAAQYKREHAL